MHDHTPPATAQSDAGTQPATKQPAAGEKPAPERTGASYFSATPSCPG